MKWSTETLILIRRESRGPRFAVPGYKTVEIPSFSTPGTPPSRPPVVDGREIVSVYRQMLFLTLVSLGQDNIDLTAFDRYKTYKR